MFKKQGEGEVVRILPSGYSLIYPPYEEKSLGALLFPLVPEVESRDSLFPQSSW